MGTLAFIDAMTGRLAWPLAAIVLGLIFRRSLIGLLERVRKLRWGDREAELAGLAEATKGVQDAVEEVAKPLPEDAEEGERESRERIEALMKTSASWGFFFGKRWGSDDLPELRVVWDDDHPRVSLDPSADPSRAFEELLRAALRSERSGRTSGLGKFGTGHKITFGDTETG